MAQKHYYRFVGNNQAEPKSRHFLVESYTSPTELMNDLESTFSGIVVTANDKSPHEVGTTSTAWSNPAKDFSNGWHMSFIPVTGLVKLN
tara:strand:+ start:525 stop:791 length:267 start_codon:yes stop_codon:yes gene_type:complete